jgi:hypothetical protein
VLSGDIKQIVIVRTNAGYGPAPGYPGTGKVVAVICVSGNQAMNFLDLLKQPSQMLAELWQPIDVEPRGSAAGF